MDKDKTIEISQQELTKYNDREIIMRNSNGDEATLKIKSFDGNEIIADGVLYKKRVTYQFPINKEFKGVKYYINE